VLQIIDHPIGVLLAPHSPIRVWLRFFFEAADCAIGIPPGQSSGWDTSFKADGLRSIKLVYIRVSRTFAKGIPSGSPATRLRLPRLLNAFLLLKEHQVTNLRACLLPGRICPGRE
jgi:hypothetical protein